MEFFKNFGTRRDSKKVAMDNFPVIKPLQPTSPSPATGAKDSSPDPSIYSTFPVIEALNRPELENLMAFRGEIMELRIKGLNQLDLGEEERVIWDKCIQEGKVDEEAYRAYVSGMMTDSTSARNSRIIFARYLKSEDFKKVMRAVKQEQLNKNR